jgi:glycosyltransferase involved in cell wall biosynthesis
MSLESTLDFTACHDCGVLHPLVDTGASHLDDAEGVDPYREFLARHRTHDIARLSRSGSACRADRPLWDPMATLTFEVTDGDRLYVVSATRRSIEDERVYRFALGVLEEASSEVRIDTRDLRRGLSYLHALSPMKIDRFLSAVNELVSQIDPDELVIAFDDADDPAVSIADMPEAMYNELLGRCTDIFDPAELSHVVTFLGDNRNADGLLALRVRDTTALSSPSVRAITHDFGVTADCAA